jgi:hypothetical protein
VPVTARRPAPYRGGKNHRQIENLL